MFHNAELAGPTSLCPVMNTTVGFYSSKVYLMLVVQVLKMFGWFLILLTSDIHILVRRKHRHHLNLEINLTKVSVDTC